MATESDRQHDTPPAGREPDEDEPRSGWFSEDEAWARRFGEAYVDHGVVDDGLDEVGLDRLEREFDEAADDEDSSPAPFGDLEEMTDE